MTAKEYLNQAYRLNELIDSNLREIERLRDMATNITSGLDERVQSSPSGDKIPRIVEKIVMLQNEVNEETDQMVNLLSEIRRVIDAVADPDEKLLLRLRYIELLRWDQIMEKMNFSKTQIHRTHNNALKNVIIPKSWN